MIITQLKDIEEIYGFIKQYWKILIAGCDGCCQPPRSLNEAKVLGQLLELKARTEGKELKVAFFTILGGEPLLRDDMWDIFKKHSDTYFQVYTNGTLIMVAGDLLPVLPKVIRLLSSGQVEGEACSGEAKRY